MILISRTRGRRENAIRNISPVLFGFLKGDAKIIKESESDKREKNIEAPDMKAFCKKVLLFIEKEEFESMEED